MSVILRIVLAALLASAGATGSAQDIPSAVAGAAAPTPSTDDVQTADAALAQDAAAYAALYGLTLAEGDRRLRAQEDTVATTDAIRATYRSRLAGIAIEQQPVFRIVVLLTGDEPVPDQLVTGGGIAVPVVFRTGAAATLDALAEAARDHQADLRAALTHPPGIGIDQRSGALVVVAAAADLDREGTDALAGRLSAIAGVPVRVRSIDRPGADAAAEGGSRLVGSNLGDGRRYLCTAGFVVSDGLRTGIATAAHCPDALSYVDRAGHEHPMPFVGQWGWGYQDVQINASDEPLAPMFLVDGAGTTSRPVTSQRGVGSIRAGDVVCHRGERTGYSCAGVELTSFAPAGDLCGGPCSTSWVTVSGPHCGGGDSGSPVFVGTTAVGILKGGSYRADGTCSFYFYMSTDYLPPDWRLLKALPG